ncbi:hypothetical protein SAY86_029154 [Trapa natans]|uniref:Uncharacterized protein n=1 Tax=Trapa natans TaxID=22666 RepID=A0AAN7LW11_TRANT|nr:hypothetical protein SAY86_029154 [Trapa natans]
MKAEDGVAKKIVSPCDVDALKKCLKENNGDQVKCQSQIEAFRTSCSLKKAISSPDASLQANVGSRFSATSNTSECLSSIAGLRGPFTLST